MTKSISITAALLLLAGAAPAFAQDQGKPDRIVLEAKVGSVMTSTGGDYVSAEQGKPLVTGESLMLNDGAKATVVYYYDNGARKCSEQYAGPNTFVIDDSCAKAAYATSTSPGASALIIAGAAGLGAAILHSMDDVPPPPPSAGAR